MAYHNKEISIIIPTTRISAVQNTLESVLVQAVNYNYEIIVVGNGVSTLKDASPDANILFLDSAIRYTPSQARNIGEAKAHGEVLLFIDDDCQLEQGSLKNVLASLKDAAIGVVTGKVDGKSKRFFAKCVDLNFYLQQGSEKCYLDRFSSAVFGIRKRLFEQMGGFDEHIIVREDIDFARRLIAAGYKILYSPDVVVIHDHKRDSFTKLLKYQYKSGLLSGLSVPFKHKSGWKDNIKVHFMNFYFLLVIPAAVWSTCKQVVGILKFKKNVLPFFPFLFLSNLCYQVGVLKWTATCKK
jgi:GT2 family glycosyltransferase